MKMNMTVKAAIQLSQGIGAIDAGYPRMIKAANGETVNNVPFKIDGGTRLRLSMTLKNLRPVVEAVDTAKKEIVKAHTPAGLPEDKSFTVEAFPDAWRKIQDDFEKVDAQEYEIVIYPIDITKLCLDDNPITSGAIVYLAPMLTEGDKPWGIGAEAA